MRGSNFHPSATADGKAPHNWVVPSMRFESDADAWELEDAEERERNAPDLYPLPKSDELNRVRPGDRVRLFFLFRGHDAHGLFLQSERLFVTVREVAIDGLVGELESPPTCSHLIATGTLISFERRHISSVQPTGEAV